MINICSKQSLPFYKHSNKSDIAEVTWYFVKNLCRGVNITTILN